MSLYCPSCGQERSSLETTYCSRCGFLLTGAAELLRTGGRLPSASQASSSKSRSQRARGIKKGIFIFLLSFLVVPLIAIATLAAEAEPYLVVISAILLAVGGLLRVAYAMMFEATEPGSDDAGGADARIISERQDFSALPGTSAPSADSYVAPQGGWRRTNDLQPRSVTENTTRLLEENRDQ